MNKTDMTVNQSTPPQPEGLHIPESLTKDAVRKTLYQIIEMINTKIGGDSHHEGNHQYDYGLSVAKHILLQEFSVLLGDEADE